MANEDGGFVDVGGVSFETSWYDWGPYAAEMLRRIKLHWRISRDLLILQQNGTTQIAFSIMNDGSVADVRIQRPSTIPPYTHAAMQAILESDPFRPLPKDLLRLVPGKDRERIVINFIYFPTRGRAERAAGAPLNEPDRIRRALEEAETVAVVGCSPDPSRASHAIARYLMSQGYRVVPVNPNHAEILGQACYPSLSERPRRTSGSTSWTCSGGPSTSPPVAARGDRAPGALLLHAAGGRRRGLRPPPRGAGDRGGHGPLHPGRARTPGNSPQIEECRPLRRRFLLVPSRDLIEEKDASYGENHQTGPVFFGSDRGRRRLRHGGRGLRQRHPPLRGPARDRPGRPAARRIGRLLPSFADTAQEVDARRSSRSPRPTSSRDNRGRRYQQNPFGEGDPFEFFFGPPDGQNRRGQPRDEEEHKEVQGGTGFIISEDGYIVTNNHVIEGADKIEVRINNKEKYPAKLVGQDAATDLALLKIDVKQRLTPLPLGDSDKVRVGEWVMAIGDPLNFDKTVTVGVVSAKDRSGPDGRRRHRGASRTTSRPTRRSTSATPAGRS